MQDAAFKMVFCHPVAIEKLVRRYAPERAGEIDFSTLAKLDSELVGETLLRRYPDMLWIARTRDRTGHAVMHLEFQSARDPLMALRMAVYQLLAVQELLKRSLRHRHSLEVLSFVIYHGRGQWRESTRLSGLFPNWAPGSYRVVSRGPGASPGDLAATVIELQRSQSVEGTLAALAELRRIGEDSGSDYGRLLAECVGEMLVSTKRLTRRQLGEATTMAQVATEYQRSLERYGRSRFRQGLEEGRNEGRREGRTEYQRSLERYGRSRFRQGLEEGRSEGQAALLARLVGAKFGRSATEEVASLIDRMADAEHMLLVGAVLECATVEEFLRRVRRLAGS